MSPVEPCEHAMIQALSPKASGCIICGKRRATARKKTLADAFIAGRDAAQTAVPKPFAAQPYNRAGYTRPLRAPARDEAETTGPEVLDAAGLAALLRRTDAELMRRSLAEFVKGAWHVVNPGEEIVWGPHLDAICDHVQWVIEELLRVRGIRKRSGRIVKQAAKNLLINVPPRSAKSLIVAVFMPVWAWLHDPTLKIRCTSGNLRVSDLCSEQAFDLIQSPWFRETFETEWTIRGDRSAKRKWNNSAGGVRISMPMGAKVTGEGTDIIVVDDPQDAADAFSEKKRDAVMKKWNSGLRNRVNHPQHHVRIVIMQRLHEADFTGQVLERGGIRWVHLCIPMEFEPDRACVTALIDRRTGAPWKDWRTVPGELMHPEFFDREFVEAEKLELRSYNYAGQHQQRPAPEDGGFFKKAWFKGYDASFLPDGKPNWATMPKVDQLYVSIDAAFKETETSDFVSMQVIGRQGRFRYVLDNVTRRMDFVKTLAALRLLLERWGKVSAILIEGAANGNAAITMLQSAGVAGVIEIKPDGGKNSRANAVAPACEAGDVMIPNHAPWRDGWLHEMAVFPNGAHDDQVDAFTQALNYMRGSVDVARLLASCKW